MREIVTIAAGLAGAAWLWGEYQASQRYGQPMFSQALRQLREQDAGF